MIFHDCESLRLHFNKLFNKVYEIKDRELRLARERIEKIIKIDADLKLLFNKSVPEVPNLPIWKIEEQPEKIITVEDEEVSVVPYLSPSEQNLLEQQKADEERLKQLKLADNFHDHALMTMMDGVLEVRWENTIKKDIPKPQCMLDKSSKEYTEEEMQIVKKYEEDVEFLMNEREKYRKILETSYQDTMVAFKEGNKKFNARLEDLFKVGQSDCFYT